MTVWDERAHWWPVAAGYQELGAARPWRRRERRKAAPTTTGQASTTRWPVLGKRDGTVYERRNQWLNPLKNGTGSNLVDMGSGSSERASECSNRTCGSASENSAGDERLGE